MRGQWALLGCVIAVGSNVMNLISDPHGALRRKPMQIGPILAGVEYEKNSKRIRSTACCRFPRTHRPSRW